jgi:hypothetical protein
MNNDIQAEQCIVEACQMLATVQIPLNSITVPDTAIAILEKEINYDDASERIYNQINTMILNGKLKLSQSQTQTWDLFNNG